MEISHKYIKQSCPEQDRLSNLPTDILYHILSFLDVTEVVKTSLVSRKWRCIYDSAACLNFDFREFWNQNHCLALSYDNCVIKFWIFVKWAFMMRDASPIHKLQFFCDYFDGYHLEILFYLCVKQNVQELYINAGYGVQQCSVYSALQPSPEHVNAITQNLKYLLELVPFTGFWNLKTLRLVGVRFPDASITEKLFGEWGVLENLSVESCCFIMIKFLRITSNKLKRLNFMNHGLTWSRRMCMFEGQLELQTPSLVSFCYTGPVLRLSESSDILSLKNASILLRRHYDPRVPPLESGVMVSGMHHIQTLSVSAVFALYFAPAFHKPWRKFTPFHHLKCLKSDLECNANHMEGLINILQLCPNLDALRIQLVRSWMAISWKSREVDVSCLSRNLKEIEIVAFHDSLNSLELIKFFLQNGKSLERIKIVLKGKKFNPEKFYALHDVQLASDAVSVSFSSTSASGRKELINIVYGKCGVRVQTKASRSTIRIRRSIRIAAKKYGGSS